MLKSLGSVPPPQTLRKLAINKYLLEFKGIIQLVNSFNNYIYILVYMYSTKGSIKSHCKIVIVIIIHLPMKMEPIERSETSASNTQTPGNYPKETVLQ
jgi:hypothetical protein